MQPASKEAESFFLEGRKRKDREMCSVFGFLFQAARTSNSPRMGINELNESHVVRTLVFSNS